MLIKVIFEIDKSEEDLLTERLFAYGVISVSTHFREKDLLVEALINRLSRVEIRDQFKDYKLKIEQIDEKDWINEWTDNFSGIEINNDIYIKKYQSVAPEKNYLYLINLDVKDAFGAGTHPTTYLSINLLYELIINDNKNIHTMLDIGCGSGILSVCASLLGISQITAFDISKKAVCKTSNNCKLNNCKNIDIFNADINQYKAKDLFHLVVANILTEIIIKNIDTIINCCNNGGYILLSGISKNWQQQIETLLFEKRLIILKKQIKDNWLAYLLKKDY